MEFAQVLFGVPQHRQLVGLAADRANQQYRQILVGRDHPGPLHLALDGHIGRDRPRGTWISGQFRWSPVERWLPDGIRELPVDAARAELVRRWLLTFGPGTRDDIAWWTGWGVGPTRQALAAVGAVEVRLDDGQVGYVLPDDLEATPEPGPWVALLPALDATTMGWKDRGWYLGPHRAALFDSAGNAGPTIWVDGRIVGGWAQRPSGEIAVRLLEKIDTETARMIDAEAARLAAWLAARIMFPSLRLSVVSYVRAQGECVPC